MIINLTNKPFSQFNAMQRLAACGERVVDNPDDFVEFYDLHASSVTAVIVDASEDNFIFNNDVCNIVDCRVVTLDVEIDVDKNKANFIIYDPNEL